MALFWHQGDAESLPGRLPAERQQLAHQAAPAGRQRAVPAVTANVAHFPLCRDDLRHRRYPTIAQAMAANDEIAEIVQQAVVDVVLDGRGHVGLPRGCETILGRAR